jgi:hypothetical protein
MVNLPIDITLERINRGYQPGTLAWIKKRRPEDWTGMIELEKEINRTALQGYEEGLIKVLREYEGFLLQMVKAFKTPIGETGNLF